MSKGFGKWQRAILEALDKQDRVILRDLLPPDFSQAQLSALYRAANGLRLSGKIWIVSAPVTWRKRYQAVERINGRPPQVWLGDKCRKTEQKVTISTLI